MAYGGLTKNKLYCDKGSERTWRTHHCVLNTLRVIKWINILMAQFGMCNDYFCRVMQLSSCGCGPVRGRWVSGGWRWKLQDEHEREAGSLQQAVPTWEWWGRPRWWARWWAPREAEAKRSSVPHPAHHSGRSQPGEKKISQSLTPRISAFCLLHSLLISSHFSLKKAPFSFRPSACPQICMRDRRPRLVTWNPARCALYNQNQKFWTSNQRTGARRIITQRLAWREFWRRAGLKAQSGPMVGNRRSTTNRTVKTAQMQRCLEGLRDLRGWNHRVIHQVGSKV